MRPTFVSCWREFSTALGATLITMCAGTTIGWTSPTLPRLLDPSSPLPLSRAQSSWIASLMILSSAMSPLPAAYLADRLGRKPTLLLSGVPYIIGWVLIMQADSVLLIYISRIVSGIGYGIAYTIAPMYLGEISSDVVRGSTTTLITVMSKIGILSQYSIGPYVSMKLLAAINMCIPICFILIFMWLPESPYFYLKINKKNKAETSLQKLRGKTNIKNELDNMEKVVDDDMRHKGTWKDLLGSKGNRKALIIILGIYTVQQFCGSTAVISYSQQIFDQADGGLSPEIASIILGSVQLVTSAASSLLVDRLGRRPLLLLSSSGVAVSNMIVGTYFLLKFLDADGIDDFHWVPVVAIVIFIFSYTVGLATVPFAITSEMFPTNVKSLAVCMIQTYTALVTFAVTKLYQVVADGLGTYVAFWGFAFFSLLGILFIFILLPETKGLSFATIQDELNNIKPTQLESDPKPKERTEEEL